MITPQFKLTQEDNFVMIEIRAPYCNLGGLVVDVNQNIFLFMCKPYYLRLNLPGNIFIGDSAKSSFDADTGEFSFRYPKTNPGEHFNDLDLITMLSPTTVGTNPVAGSLPIEVISESETEEVNPEETVDPEDAEYGFGFALRAHQISSAFDGVFEIDPSEVCLKDRRRLRQQYEQGKFNIDHYLADFSENDEIWEIIAQPCPFINAQENPDLKFTPKELDLMKNLPNVQYELSGNRVIYCINGLIDILFAYCFDQRTTYFVATSESNWTITKLASSFSWLDAFSNPKEVLISAFRRSMIYPLHRHFELAQKVFQDLKTLIQLDPKYITKALLQIYEIFLCGDSNRYVLNNLFIKDYINYVMRWDNNDLWTATVINVLSIEIKKEDLGLNLPEIEEFYLKDKRAIWRSDESNNYTSDDSSSSSDTEIESDDSTEPTDATRAVKSCFYKLEML